MHIFASVFIYEDKKCWLHAISDSLHQNIFWRDYIYQSLSTNCKQRQDQW